MLREDEEEEERGDAWRATRDIEWHVYVCVCVFVVHCLKPTQPGRQSKREREKERETDIDNQRGGA